MPAPAERIWPATTSSAAQGGADEEREAGHPHVSMGGVAST